MTTAEQLPGVEAAYESAGLFRGQTFTGHDLFVTNYKSVGPELSVVEKDTHRTILSVRFGDPGRARESILAAAALLLSLVDGSPESRRDAEALCEGVLA